MGMNATTFNPHQFERKMWSQFGEDGVLLELIRRLQPPHSFFEIGSGDGSENCTRVLAEVEHWTGVWIDASLPNVVKSREVARPLGIRTVCVHVDLEMLRNITSLVAEELGVLSIDIDGNDYHVWEEICRGKVTFNLRPWVVIIEAQIQRPHNEPWVMDYDPKYAWDHKSHDCGASVFSMNALGRELGYTSVGMLSNPHAPNMFFVRDDLLERLG